MASSSLSGAFHSSTVLVQSLLLTILLIIADSLLKFTDDCLTCWRTLCPLGTCRGLRSGCQRPTTAQPSSSRSLRWCPFSLSSVFSPPAAMNSPSPVKHLHPSFPFAPRTASALSHFCNFRSRDLKTPPAYFSVHFCCFVNYHVDCLAHRPDIGLESEGLTISLARSTARCKVTGAMSVTTQNFSIPNALASIPPHCSSTTPHALLQRWLISH